MKSIASLLAIVTLSTVVYAQNTYPWPASGNVGIGTTSPTTALEVNGSVTATGPYSFIAKAAEGYWGFNHGNFYAGQGGDVYNVGFSSGAIGIFNGSTTAQDVFLFNRNNPASGFLVLKANDNVGIGTSSPSQRLDLNGNLIVRGTQGFDTSGEEGIVYLGDTNGYIKSVYDGGLRFRSSSVSGDAVAIAASGNVGIGTTNPEYNLTVYGGGNPSLGISAGNVPHLWLKNGYGGLAVLDVYNDNSLRIGVENNSGTTDFVIAASGNIGMGTASPTEKLSVNGKIRAKEVIVETTGWSDHVFTDSYQLQSLADVEQHIKTEKHLPGVPSAQEVAEKGVSVGDMQAILLAKIEELTLHQIAQEKELAALRTDVTTLKAENAQLKAANQ